MRKVIKNFRLNLFTCIEILFAFTVITIAISVDLGYYTETRSNTAREDSRYILYILNAFTVLAVFVTALGITGIQLIRLYRRTEEIGLRKAVGAGDWDIVMLILTDTFRMLLVPALCGIASGIALALVIPFERLSLYLRPKIDLRVILGSAAALCIFTVLSGILPALKAISMNPAEVLRKHVALKREKVNRALKPVLFAVILAVTAGGFIINYRLEAEYKKDILNSSGAPPAATQAVPAFSFKDAAGTGISSASLQNKAYCLLIWETNCSLSADVLQELSKLVAQGRLRAGDVYAISLDKSVKTAEAYLNTHNISLNAYTDDGNSVKWAFNVNAMPALYIVDSKGVINARLLGWSDQTGEYIADRLSVFESE